MGRAVTVVVGGARESLDSSPVSTLYLYITLSQVELFMPAASHYWRFFRNLKHLASPVLMVWLH